MAKDKTKKDKVVKAEKKEEKNLIGEPYVDEKSSPVQPK